jgi:hypothetical protein
VLKLERLAVRNTHVHSVGKADSSLLDLAVSVGITWLIKGQCSLSLMLKVMESM